MGGGEPVSVFREVEGLDGCCSSLGSECRTVFGLAEVVDVDEAVDGSESNEVTVGVEDGGGEFYLRG